jgi:hypothetical protein
LADRDRHLAIQMLLDQTGGIGGGVDLLVFMNHPEAHHDGRGHGAENRKTNGHTNQKLDEREAAQAIVARTTRASVSHEIHGVARTTVSDCA